MLRKIDVSDYVTEEGENYLTKKALKSLLFSPQLELNSQQLIENYELWKKIDSCGHMTIDQQLNVVVVEEAEYKILLHAVNRLRGYTLNDYVLVNRILNAEEYKIPKYMQD